MPKKDKNYDVLIAFTEQFGDTWLSDLSNLTKPTVKKRGEKKKKRREEVLLCVYFQQER